MEVGPVEGSLDPHGPHTERPGHPGHLNPDGSHAHNHQATARKIGAGVALPVVFRLVLEGPEKPLPERQHCHEAELSQRDRVHTTRGGEDRIRHALGITESLDELSDASARGLNPTDTRSALGQVVEVRVIEVEEGLGTHEVGEPDLFVLVRALEGRARVVGGVTGCRDETRLVDHLDPRVDRAYALHMMRLEVAGDDETHGIS